MPDPEEIQQPDADSGETPGDAPATTPPQLPDNLDVEELLSMGSAQPADPPPSLDDDADDAEEDDEEGDEDDSEGDPDGTPVPQASTPEAIRAAGEMIAATPRRINELPAKQRAAAIEEAMRLAYNRGGLDMFAHQTAQSTQEQGLRAFYDERMAARTDDPEEFAIWEDEHPEDAERFAAARRYFKAKSEGKPAPLPGTPAKPADKAGLTESQQTIQNLANREAKRLAALPQDVQTRIAGQGFTLTEDGLEAFRQAISDAEAAIRKGGPGAAQRRQEAHRERLATPRVDVGQRGNAAPPKKNPIADINDPDALMEMAVSGAQSRRRG